MKKLCGLVALLVLGFRQEKADPEGLAFFEKKIRPVLIDRCYSCHSAEAKKLKGELYVDSREGLLKGGELGPSVVPGDPDKSLLIKAIRYKDEDLKMPPKGKLSPEVVADFEAWVKRGAPDPRGKGATAAKREINIEAGKKYWAFQPLRAGKGTGVDEFLGAKFQAAGVKPAGATDARRLVRRATFDLLGLPPTPEEVDAFVADPNVGKLIDRLLTRPEYGERWARHWLDVARFAESHGFEQDYDRENAFHYRDFLIQAFNQDLPYDRFVQWQIAGDELASDQPLAWMATGFLGAGAFPTQLTEVEFEPARYDELDNMASTTSSAFLGLSVGCARCHDHKFDPFPSRDYYRLASTFTTTIRSMAEFTLDPEGDRAALAAWETAHAPLVAALEKFEKEELPGRFAHWLDGRPWESESWTVLDVVESGKRTLRAKTTLGGITSVRLDAAKDKKGAAFPPKTFKVSANGKAVALTAGKPTADHIVYELAEPVGGVELVFEVEAAGRISIATEPGLDPALDSKPQAVAELCEVLRAGGKPGPDAAAIYGKIDPEAVKLRKAVEAHAKPTPKITKVLVTTDGMKPLKHHADDRGFPHFYKETHVLARGDVTKKQGVATQGFLQVLISAPEQEKRWISDAPAGSRTPMRRTALAKWLTDVDAGAGALVARVIVNRLWAHHFGRGLVATPNDFGVQGEPPSHPELLDWLAAELIRNGWRLKPIHKLLMTSAAYGRSTEIVAESAARDPDNKLFWRRDPRRLEAEAVRDSLLDVGGLLDRKLYGPGTLDETMTRRSIYFFIKRSRLIPMMMVFDAPEPLVSQGGRPTTTIAPQALLFMNSPLVRKAAAGLAKQGSVEKIYRRALGRLPGPKELAAADAFLSRQAESYKKDGKPDASLVDLAQALLCLNEFVYVD